MAKANVQGAKGKPPKERPILHKVIAGLIVAGLLWLASILCGFWQVLVAAFSYLWGMVTEPLSLPVWVFSLLVLGDVVLVLAFVGEVVSWLRKGAGPSWEHYTDDVFFGMRWRWTYAINSDTIINLWCYCPKDDTRLVYSTSYDCYATVTTTFFCETCGERFAPIEAKLPEALGQVERQVDRKIRTAEWRNVVREEGEQ